MQEVEDPFKEFGGSVVTDTTAQDNPFAEFGGKLLNQGYSISVSTSPAMSVDEAAARASDEVLKATNPLLNIPVIGDLALKAGKMIYGVVADQIPQTISTGLLKDSSYRLKALQDAINSHPQAGNEERIPVAFQETTMMLPKSQVESMIAQEKGAIPKYLNEIDTQKNEFRQKTASNIQELSKVETASDLVNWIGSSVGQAAGQIPLSVLTGGQSSYLMEAAEVYDTQLDLLAEKTGKSKQELILQGLDSPAAGQAYAVIAGALDAVSAGSVLKLFRGVAGKTLKKSLIPQALKEALGEGVTEGAQGQLEQFGGTRGAGVDYQFDSQRFLNEFAAGVVGAGGLSMINPSTDKQVNRTIADLTPTDNTGIADIDVALADTEATISAKGVPTQSSNDLVLKEQELSNLEDLTPAQMTLAYAIREELANRNITEEDKLNIINNALQEQSPNEVPVQPEAGGSEGMGTEVQQPQEPTGTVTQAQTAQEAQQVAEGTINITDVMSKAATFDENNYDITDYDDYNRFYADKLPPTIRMGGASIDIRANGNNEIELFSLKSTNKNKGEASLLLKRITEEADKNGTVLKLTALAGKDGLSQGELIKFYERNGFVIVPNGQEVGRAMIRLPKTTAPSEQSATEQTVQPTAEVTPVIEQPSPRATIQFAKEPVTETVPAPVRLFKGLFGKRNIDGTVRSAHPNVKGKWATLDEAVAKRYTTTEEPMVEQYELPAGTTIETIEVNQKGLSPEAFRQQETDAINNSTAQVVKLVTTDSRGREEQYVIRDQNLSKPVQPTAPAKTTSKAKQVAKKVSKLSDTDKTTILSEYAKDQNAKNQDPTIKFTTGVNREGVPVIYKKDTTRVGKNQNLSIQTVEDILAEKADDKILKTLDNLIEQAKPSRRGRAQMSVIPGFDYLVYGSLKAVRATYIATKDLAKAIQAGVDYMKKTKGIVPSKEQFAKYEAFIADKLKVTPTKQVADYVEMLKKDDRLSKLPRTSASKQGVTEVLNDFFNTNNITDPELQQQIIDAWNEEGIRYVNKTEEVATTKSAKPEKAKPFNGETVVRTINEEIIKLTKQFVKGKVAGVKQQFEATKTLIDKLKAKGVLDKLEPRQVRQLLTKLQRTNPFSIGSISELNRFIEKVTSDAAYSLKLSEARKGRAKIKERLQAAKKPTVAAQNALSNFLLLDPTDTQVFPEVDSYLFQLNNILNSFGGTLKEETKAFDIAAVNAFTKAALQQEFALLYPGVDFNGMSIIDLSVAIKEKKFSEASEELPQETTSTPEDKKAALGDKLRALAFTRQTEFKPNIDGLSKEEAATANAYKKLNLTDLTNDQLREYIRTLDNIRVNNDFGYTGKTLNIYNAQQGIKKANSLLGSLNKLINTTQYEEFFSSMPLFFKSMFGKSELASEFQVATGIFKTSDAYRQAFNARQELNKKLEANYKAHPEVVNKENVDAAGVYAYLIQHPTDITEAQALENNRNIIKEDIATLEAAGRQRDANVLREMYNKLNSDTIEGVKKRMKDQYPHAYSTVQILIDHYAGDIMTQFIDYNNRYFNQKIIPVTNYVGELRTYAVKGKGISQRLTDDPSEDLFKKYNDFVTGTTAQPTLSRSALVRTRSPKTDPNDRTKILPNGKNRVSNYTIYEVALNHTQKTVFQMNAIDGMLQTHYMKEPLRTGLFKDNQGLWEAIFRGTNDPGGAGVYETFIKSSLGVLNNNDTNEFVKKGLSWLQTISYRSTLAGPTQYLKQAAVLANVATQIGPQREGLLAGSAYDLMMQKTNGADKWIKLTMASLREDELSAYSNMGTLEMDVPKAISSSVLTGKINEIMQNKSLRSTKEVLDLIAGLKALTRSDLLAAEVSYMTFYRSYLDRKGLTFTTWENESERYEELGRQEAHAYAKQRVDELQVVSNPNEQSKAVLAKSTGARVLKALHMPFGTFAANTAMRGFLSIKNLAMGSRAIRLEATRDFFAATIETIAYNKIKSLAAAGALVAANAILKGGEDEPEEEKLRKEEEKILLARVAGQDLSLTPQEAQAIGQDMIPLYLGDPLWKATMLGINAGYQWANEGKLNEDGVPMTDKELEIFSVPMQSSGGVAILRNSMGSLATPFVRAEEIGSILKDANRSEEDAKYAGELLRQEATKVGLINIAQTMGWFPSDIGFATTREYKRRKEVRIQGLVPIEQ